VTKADICQFNLFFTYFVDNLKLLVEICFNIIVI